jgi:hypothetical protein
MDSNFVKKSSRIYQGLRSTTSRVSITLLDPTIQYRLPLMAAFALARHTLAVHDQAPIISSTYLLMKRHETNAYRWGCIRGLGSFPRILRVDYHWSSFRPDSDSPSFMLLAKGYFRQGVIWIVHIHVSGRLAWQARLEALVKIVVN